MRKNAIMRAAMRPHPPRADKLDLLRRGDTYRKWDSLDDHRVCVLCEKRISGRQVEVSLVRGKPKLSCPTEGCTGGPHEWVYPGNPLTSKRSWTDWCRLWEEDGGMPQANPPLAT